MIIPVLAPQKKQYKLSSTPSWIRSRINKGYGFQTWPWLYVNIKFRPHNGDYKTYVLGGATDCPVAHRRDVLLESRSSAACIRCFSRHTGIGRYRKNP